MLDTRPFQASYYLFEADEGGSPWPIEDGEPPTLHLLGDGNWSDKQRLVRLIADRNEPTGLSLLYTGSAIATYDVLEVTYPGGIGSRRIIRHASGADLATAFGEEAWWNIDGDGWLHAENVPMPERDMYEITDFVDESQPTSYQVQFHVRTEHNIPITGTWSEVLGLTLDDVDLPVEKHYHDGSVEADGVVAGKRAVIAGSEWTHATTRATPINKDGIQNLLTTFGDHPPSPWGGPFPTNPEHPCYVEDPPMPAWPTAFGTPARYYGPTGGTSWKLVLNAGLTDVQFTAGVAILETDGMNMIDFVGSLNAWMVDEITGCPIQVVEGDPVFNDTPAYDAPKLVLGVYSETSPWGSYGGVEPVECAPQPFPLDGVSVPGGYAVDVGDLVLAFHAIEDDNGGFHDFREASTALGSVTAYLEGGDKLIYSGPLGELPRPFSGHAATFCGRSITADEPYSLDVLALDAGIRVVLIQGGAVTIWDEEANVLWSDTLANTLPPDLYDALDLSDPVQGYRFVTDGWPHRTGVVTVGGANLLVEARHRLRDVRYRGAAGKPPVTFAFGWAL